MLKILRRHWQGGNSLWVSLLCCSLVVTAAALFIAISFLGSISPDIPPYRRMLLATPVILAVGAIGIWQLIGTWRASSFARAGAYYRISRWFARLSAVGMALLAFAMVATLPTLLNRLYVMATDRDEYGLGGNTLTVSDNNLLITGYFSWGLLDRVEAALDENPGVDTVVLNSPGGHAAVGRHLSVLFGTRHLNTTVVDLCASACTYAFSGGEHRLAGPKARIGFHTEFGDNPHTVKLSQETSRAFWTKFGLPPEFIQKVNDTPQDDIWFPSLQELRNLNYITD
jgi:hypothetical protein